MQNFPRRTSGRAPPSQAARAPWAAPFRIIPDSAYCALCRILHNAHGLRDLAGLYRFDPDGQVWARSMAGLLIDANAAATAARTVLNGAEDSHGFGVFAAFIVPTGDGGEMAWSAAAPRR